MSLFRSPTCLSPTPRLDPDASISSGSQNHSSFHSLPVKKPCSGSRQKVLKGTKRSRSSPRKTKQPRAIGGQQLKGTTSKGASAAGKAVVPSHPSPSPRLTTNGREGRHGMPRPGRQPSNHLHALGPAPLDFNPGDSCDGHLSDRPARLDPSPDLLARLRSMELKLERECGESFSADADAPSNDRCEVSSSLASLQS